MNIKTDYKKNRMKRFLFFGLAFFLFNNLSAQDFRFGLSFNAATSKVQSNFSFPEDYGIFFKRSAKIGLLVEKKLSKRSALGMELLWVLIEGQEYRYKPASYWYTTRAGGRSGTSGTIILTDNTKIHSHYIGVPAYYRFSLGRFSIKGGLQALILMSLDIEKSHLQKGVIGAETEPFLQYDTADKIPLRKYDLGPQFGLDFRLSKHLRLRIDYFQGLTNLYTDGGEWQRKNRQFSFGVDYWFGRKSF